MKKLGLILFFSMLSFYAYSQKSNNDIRKANKLYEKKKYIDAEIGYKKGMLKESNSFDSNFNLGNAFFRQEEYNEALEQYKNSIALSKGEKAKQAAAFHNIGNTLLLGNKIDESIEAYKTALKKNPGDDETRYNLAFAQLMKKKQEEEDEKNGENKDKDKQEDNKQEQEQGKEQDQKDQNEDKGQQEQQAQKAQISKENAEQILNSIQEDEKELQGKINKEDSQATKNIEKKW